MSHCYVVGLVRRLWFIICKQKKLQYFGQFTDLINILGTHLTFLNSDSWSILLNAFFKSINNPTMSCVLSMASVIYSINLINAKVIALFVINPYWFSLISLLSSIKLAHFCGNHFSSTLENRESDDTGLLLLKICLSPFIFSLFGCDSYLYL